MHVNQLNEAEFLQLVVDFIDCEREINDVPRNTLTKQTIASYLLVKAGKMSVQEFKERYQNSFTRKQLQELQLCGMHIMIYERAMKELHV